MLFELLLVIILIIDFVCFLLQKLVLIFHVNPRSSKYLNFMARDQFLHVIVVLFLPEFKDLHAQPPDLFGLSVSVHHVNDLEKNCDSWISHQE